MISIVDDDAFVRDAIADLLSSLGYPVRTFPSAREFLASGHLKNTDCLITDLQMPDLDGLELQDHVFGYGHCIPIIFITAFPNEMSGSARLAPGRWHF